MSRAYEIGSRARLEEYPPIFHAWHIQEMLGVWEAVTYQIMHPEKCPTLKMGKRVALPRDDFWKF